MIPNFDWDLEKASSNVAKHGVSFEEAATVFGDDDGVMDDDVAHSESEDRFIIVGTSHRDRLLAVSYAVRGEIVRIISARHAERHEKRTYEENYRARR